MAVNVYEIITQRFLDKLDQGIIPWQKPWKVSKELDGSQFFPCYPYGKKKPYDIINQMLLGFEPGQYATFNQITKAGGKVKKGEKSQIICGWIFSKEALTDKATGEIITDDDGNELTKDRFALRYYNVFNVNTQVEGLPVDAIIEEPTTEEGDEIVTIQPDAIAESIISAYVNSEALTFEAKGSNRAYYSPLEDKVVVPALKQFDNVEEYYSTAFHELTHSTMKKSRCNREEDRKGKSVAFGSEEYSKEELVAEIGAATLVNYCGLETEKSFNNSTAYIQGWSKKLKEQPKMIVYASAQAQKAIDYILNCN